jgi:poly(3-hydroxyalkanoate) depolymerase
VTTSALVTANGEQRIRIGRHRLRVQLVGEGAPLLLLMGIGGNLEMWEPLRRALPGHRLIAFDAPGTGGSSTPRVPLRMSGVARLTAELIGELGYDAVDVLGVSWGGALAQQLAISAPSRIRRLVLAATTPGLGGVPGRPGAMWVLMTPRRYYSRSYFESVAPKLYGGRIKREPELLRQQAMARLTRPPTMAGYAGQLYAITTFSSIPFLRCIKAPTLVLAGDDDPIVPMVNARILQRGIKDAELHVVRGGGHLFIFESVDEVGPVITRFLAP